MSPLVQVVIEVPKYGFVKRDQAGRIDVVSPLPCPFNYGSVPGTRADDGDPLDAVVLGSRLAAGTIVELPVQGTVHFVDAGADDPKLIVKASPLTGWDRRQVDTFFTLYAVLKRGLNLARGHRGPTEFRGWRAGIDLTQLPVDERWTPGMPAE